uniref:Uncharacterized protein n=1 Tax=Panagrolaimus davidi TaxID=227884 RepID=A0A914PSW1_9BILA
MSVRRQPLYSLVETFRRLFPATYEEARVPGMSTTTTVNDSTVSKLIFKTPMAATTSLCMVGRQSASERVSSLDASDV